jgi:NitT/TauT family transport system permease protein
MLLVASSLLVPLILWTIVSSLQLVPATFLPTPWAVLTAGFTMFAENDLGGDVLASCGRVLAGFLLAALTWCACGISDRDFSQYG